MTEMELRDKITKLSLYASPNSSVPCAMIGHEYNIWSPEKITYPNRRWAIRALLLEFLKETDEVSSSLVADYRRYFDFFYVMTNELILREAFVREKEKIRHEGSLMIFVGDGYPDNPTGIQLQKVVGKKQDEIIKFLANDITEDAKYELFKRSFFEDFVKCYLGNSPIEHTVYWYVDSDDWKKMNEKVPNMVKRLMDESEDTDERIKKLNRLLNDKLLQMSEKERQKIVEIRIDLAGKSILVVD